MFKDLQVIGLGATSSYYDTFGSSLNPINIKNNIRKALHPPVKNILQGFSGVVQPGEMLRAFGPLFASKLRIANVAQLFSVVLALAAVPS
jgi:hypothetical protein